MFDGHAHEVPLLVEIDVDVLADLLSLGDFIIRELDKGRVGVRKVFDFHLSLSLNDLSKNALCTVSPSSSRITRRTFPVSLMRPRFADLGVVSERVLPEFFAAGTV
jgi:hypothetical protein